MNDYERYVSESCNGRNESMKIWILRILLLALILWWMLTIYDFSGDTGEESQSLSDKITIKVVHFIEKDFDSLDPKEQKEIFDRTSYCVRKIGHLGEFAILAIFVSFFVMTFQYMRTHRKLVWIIPTIVCFLYALSDEIHQGFVADRTPQVFDVCVDVVGGMCGAVFVYVINFVITNRKRKSHE